MTARPYSPPRRRFFNYREGVGYTDARLYASTLKALAMPPGSTYQQTFDTICAAYHYTSNGRHFDHRVNYRRGWRMYFRDEAAAFTATFLREPSALRSEADRWLESHPFQEVLPA